MPALALPRLPEAPAIRRSARRAAERARDADVLPLLGFGAAVAAAAVVGARAGGTPRRSPTRWWYRTLRKARGTPPNAAFPIVWTALYATNAVSGWRVWRRPPSPERTRALALWGAQLALNAAWTPLFFGARLPRAALADLVALWGAVTAYGVTSRQVDQPAAWLTAPYLAWVTYAGYLNAEIVRKNR